MCINLKPSGFLPSPVGRMLYVDPVAFPIPVYVPVPYVPPPAKTDVSQWTISVGLASWWQERLEYFSYNRNAAYAKYLITCDLHKLTVTLSTKKGRPVTPDKIIAIKNYICQNDLVSSGKVRVHHDALALDQSPSIAISMRLIYREDYLRAIDLIKQWANT